MNKIISLVLVATLLVILLTSCSTISKTEITEVDFTIMEVYHKDRSVQPIITVVNGHTRTTLITHPEKNLVTLKYNDYSKTIDNKELYNHCKDKVNGTIRAKLITKYYEDGRIRYDIQFN